MVESYKQFCPVAMAAEVLETHNASLGDKNPGANSYMFNFLQKF